ncbi:MULTISPECIES: ferredoxin reductase [Rhodococcus]|jgi:ferredoxin-NADP reductase|uniref:ferredoxin reductase n=1 Tax=Rhodococcus TaxID=1827 RepID=UPI0002D2420E|nr:MULTISPECIES: FAD-binding oxidoreductase [Rhodococcus]NCL76283.1 NADPH oxidoreductase [Rhodococcus sp. YH1]MBC2587025.1 ferredoxin reductase [Rhodococcus aetherivorans]QRI74869.1 ferredoxin reductase [Rhodococcus aetherivorans]QSE58279.1 ferredoxin reductase [Rhodococcus sp. PSBB066]QSE70399.1 ferredoxin reductase [Rhodococcus sp. PSBB049]
MTLLHRARRGPGPSIGRKALIKALHVLSAPHHPDRYLELADPLLAVQHTRARITNVDRNIPGAVTLELRPGRPLEFRAGQHLQLGVVVDGVRHSRSYSPVSSQHRADGRIQLTVGVRPDGVVSRHLHEHATAGDVVDLAAAAGEFCLPAERPERLVLVSGGSGITPVLSMLRTLADEGHSGTVAFLHYAPTAAHVPHRDAIESLAGAHAGVDVAFAYTRADDGALRGRFDRSHLERVAPWFAGAPAYVCGPAGLVDSVREVYGDAGAAHLLRTEQFTPPVVVRDDDASGTVTFAASGVRAENSGVTALEQAEAAGLTPQHGCRMGICHSCTVTRLSGGTRDVRTGEIDDEPGAEVQICVNVPVGDAAFDL